MRSIVFAASTQALYRSKNSCFKDRILWEHALSVGLAAAHDVWFQAQGLTLVGDGTLKECRPVFEEHSEWPAVANFFEISLAEALDLFTAGGYGGKLRPHPRDVAEKIRAHLAQAKAEVAA